MQPALEVGVALGGGFARAIAHLGVLRVLEEAGIRISAIAGVSAGAIVAAAYASGTRLDEICDVASSMRFADVARWSISKMGLAKSRRMKAFLRKLLKVDRFEQMRIPLAVVATDLGSGAPRVFRDSGEVVDPIRASCAYPGLFEPVEIQGSRYVDGAIGIEVPALPLRSFNLNRVISVRLAGSSELPGNLFEVVGRCFRIMNDQMQHSWRAASDCVIEPNVEAANWDGFASTAALIQSGEVAARDMLSAIRGWGAPLSEHLPDQFPANAGQPLVQSLIEPGQLGVIEAQQVQHRGMQI